jgi:hypothetical protein
MILKIYKETEERKTLQFRLVKENEDLHLEVLDDNGKVLCIAIVITPRGQLLLPNKIPLDVGLSVGNYGRMQAQQLAVKTNPGGSRGKRFFD